jgi:two-component system phosphate regulon sensor histidine kinase PhoR
MASKVRKLIEDYSNETDALNIIISSIQEGLLVLDRRGKIILCNKKLGEITGVENPRGRMHWEVLRDPGLADFIKSIGPDNPEISREIEIKGRIYACAGALLPSTEQTIITLHDITEIRSLEKVKRDFVVNVSHELRTPLTAIKGYIETMEESVDETNREYLEILKRNTDRLIAMIGDLLLLSELEEVGFRLEVEPVNLNALLENQQKMFEAKLRQKRLELEVDVDEYPTTIEADRFKIEQMFLNLIDNAIKYTEKGSIVITVNHNDENVVINIEDTGIGITREHLPRIFERFYVTDKSRSRRLGGTGLGLSIVKHIVLLHKGVIFVNSTPGVGTTFTVTLPIVHPKS